MRRVGSREGYEVVFTHSLQGQKGGRTLTRIGDQMRPKWRNGIRFTGAEFDHFLWITEQNSDPAFKDIERVLSVVVIMPRHKLGRRNPQFIDSKPRPIGMSGLELDLIVGC